MRLVVIGANGQLGTDLVREARSRSWDVTGLDHAHIAIEDAASVEMALPPRTDAIVNTAAFHNLDACERDAERAFAVNAAGPLVLARWAERHGARLIQISTDYVFGGDTRQPYAEDALPGPLNVYGASKLAGEQAALAHGDNVVVRVAGLYGSAPCRAKGGDNFVRLMLRLGRERGTVNVVDDQWTSPTYTLPLAARICDVATLPALGGIVHAAAHGACTWCDFARAIFAAAGMTVEVVPVSSAAFPSVVRRPAYSALRSERLASAGIVRIPSWTECLTQFLSAEGLLAG